MWNRAVVSPVVKDRAQKLCSMLMVRACSSVQAPPALESLLVPVAKKNKKEQRISQAMKIYLERVQQRNALIAEKRAEFELGKRHLANIMGWNPEDISQEEIDSAIEYLLPSGLFEKKSRPLMKPPEVFYAKQRAAQFDTTGRPLNAFFYTGKGKFYTHLHDAYAHICELDKHQIKMRAKGVSAPPSSEKFEIGGYTWVTKDQLVERINERISDENYEYFLSTMGRLAEHPYSNSAKSFLVKFLHHRDAGNVEQHIMPLMHDEAGNPYMEAKGGRKTARADVRVTGNGTGQVLINKCRTVDEYFPDLKDRIQIMYPLQFTGMIDKVDITATVYWRRDEYEVGRNSKVTPEEQEDLIKPLSLMTGRSCEAGAIRLGVAKALCSFVTREDVSAMRLAGLLTRDVRFREKKKYNHRGARRRYPWRKR